MPKGENKYICCRCNMVQPLKNYYKSYSHMFSEGHLPICKTCFLALYDQYTTEYQSTKKALQRMCMAFDLYYNETLFESCESNRDTLVGNYIRKLNMKQNTNKTFDTSIEEGFDVLSGEKRVKGSKNKKIAIVDEFGNEQDEEVKVSSKDLEKWGMGLEPDDYRSLNDHYKFLKNANPNCDNNQEIFILDLCYTKMQQLKAVREGRIDDFNKLTESYRKSFAQAGLKTTPDEMKTADDCWSAWVNSVSQYTPEEFYKNKELYKDFDGLGEYYERFAVRPLRNLQTGTSDRDREFFVKEDDDGDDYD